MTQIMTKSEQFRELGDVDFSSQNDLKSTKRALRQIRHAEKKIFSDNKRNQALKQSSGSQIEGEQYLENLASGCLINVPPLPSTTVQLFISSTFSDFKIERNVIFNSILPRIKEFCVQNRLGFSIIDLHLCANEDEHKAHSWTQFVSKVIQHCQETSRGPNFITLQGNRYGYQPVMASIPSQEYQTLRRLGRKNFQTLVPLLEQWYRMDENAEPPVFHVTESAVPLDQVPEPPPDPNRRQTEAELEYIRKLGAAIKASAVAGADKESWPEVEDRLRSFLWAVVDSACDLDQLPASRRTSHMLAVSDQEACQGIQAKVTNEWSAVYQRNLDGLSACFRDDTALPFLNIVHNEAGVKVISQTHGKLIDNLRRKLINRLGKNSKRVHEFRVPWSDQFGLNPDHVNEQALYLKSFVESMEQDMKALINLSLKKQKHPLNDDSSNIRMDLLLAEIHHHLYLRDELAQNFCGREEVIDTLQHWLRNQSITGPGLLLAPSGMGKSTLIARVDQQVRGWFGGKTLVKVIRFARTSTDSCRLLTLLISILRQIALAYDIVLDEARMDVLFNVQEYLAVILNKVSTSFGKARPLFVFIDAVDLLLEDNEARSLNWLPRKLPQFVKFLISSSTEEEDILEHFERRTGKIGFLCQLNPMSDTNCRDMLLFSLQECKRTLTTDQMNFAVACVKPTGSPLHARIVINDAITWTSYQEPLTIKSGSTIEEVIHSFFLRLEQIHGPILVRFAVGYITLGLNGLSIIELEDALSCNDEVLKEVFLHRDLPEDQPHNVIRIPALVWMRLWVDIKPYTRLAWSDGVQTITWKTSVMANVAYKRYASDGRAVKMHDDLAQLFLASTPVKRTVIFSTSRALVDADRMIALVPLNGRYPWKLRNIAYHLIHAHKVDQFKMEVACNFDILTMWLDTFKARRTISMLDNAIKVFSYNDVHNEDEELTSLLACLNYSRFLLKQEPVCMAEQILGQLLNAEERHTLDPDDPLYDLCSMPQLYQLCKQCERYLMSNRGPRANHMRPLFDCFPSSLGSVKWQHDGIKRVVDVSADHIYILVYGSTPERQRCLRVIDTNTVGLRCCMIVPEEPIDAIINAELTMVYALYTNRVIAYDLGDGCIITEIPTESFLRENSSFAVSPTNKAVAVAGHDKVAVFFNKKLRQGYDRTLFEIEKVLTTKGTHRITAMKSMDTDKMSVLMVVHVARTSGDVSLKSSNFDTQEPLSVIELPKLRETYEVIQFPVMSRNLVPIRDTGKVLVVFADGQLCLVDIFAQMILWHHEEPLDTSYLPLVVPRLRNTFYDEKRQGVFVTIAYGDHNLLRVYDLDEEKLSLAQSSSKSQELVSTACFITDPDKESEEIVLAGQLGSVVIMPIVNCCNDEHFPIDENKQTKIFKAHRKEITFALHRHDFLFSLDKGHLFKVRRLSHLRQERFERVSGELKKKKLSAEFVVSMTVAANKDFFVTSSRRLIKVWKTVDGSWIRTLRLKWENPRQLCEFIEDTSKIVLIDNDRYLIGESPEKKIVFICDFNTGIVVSHCARPMIWCASTSNTQEHHICMIYSKSETRFSLKLVNVPCFNTEATATFFAPHPGIEETVTGIILTPGHSHALIRWGQIKAKTAEAWAIPLTADKKLFNSEDEEEETLSEASAGGDSDDDLVASAGLMACKQTSNKGGLGLNKSALYWQLSSMLPLTEDRVLIGTNVGNIPVWHLSRQDCQLPFLPCMEAWMKHSVSEAFCQQRKRPPARRTYDDRVVPKSVISKLTVGSSGSDFVVSGAVDGTIVVWQCRAAALERDYDLMKSWGYRLIIRDAHTAQITCLQLTKKDTFLISASLDRSMCLSDVSNGTLYHRLYTHTPLHELHLDLNCNTLIALAGNLSEKRVMIFKLQLS